MPVGQIIPQKYNLTIYKGSSFVLEFKIKDEVGYVDLSTAEIIFKAIDKNKETVIDLSSETSGITTLDNLIRVVVADTTALPDGPYKYVIETIEGEITRRWLTGNIDVYEDIG